MKMTHFIWAMTLLALILALLFIVAWILPEFGADPATAIIVLVSAFLIGGTVAAYVRLRRRIIVPHDVVTRNDPADHPPGAGNHGAHRPEIGR